MSDGDFGAFLRAHREQVTPSQAGIGMHGSPRRRVTGLRREEVAQLAGLSPDYYTRLEQGRERRPSAQIVESLAAALRLTGDARLHLFRLAGTAAIAPVVASARVDPALVDLVAAWPNNPALIYNRAYDVLACNAIADALFSDWSHSRNLLRVVFTDPMARTFYRDWPEVAADAVAGFRLGYGEDPGDPRVREVLSAMLSDSEDFVRLWSRHHVRGKSLREKRFAHPDVGEVTLTMQAFDVRSAPRQELVVYHAEHGSPSAQALALLGSLAASVSDEKSEQGRL